ncbi:MAG TPA: hypothetical protein VL360_07645, partial [Gammaproteobacteria bacterium]|nr:hypothetical protein [Gammaproteobacteria bacterium]
MYLNTMSDCEKVKALSRLINAHIISERDAEWYNSQEVWKLQQLMTLVLNGRISVRDARWCSDDEV